MPGMQCHASHDWAKRRALYRRVRRKRIRTVDQPESRPQPSEGSANVTNTPALRVGSMIARCLRHEYLFSSMQSCANALEQLDIFAVSCRTARHCLREFGGCRRVGCNIRERKPRKPPPLSIAIRQLWTYLRRTPSSYLMSVKMIHFAESTPSHPVYCKSRESTPSHPVYCKSRATTVDGTYPPLIQFSKNWPQPFPKKHPSRRRYSRCAPSPCPHPTSQICHSLPSFHGCVPAWDTPHHYHHNHVSPHPPRATFMPFRHLCQ